MLAVLYLIIAVFFGTQLIRLLIPDIRRLYVGVASDQSILEKVPTSLFLFPAGTLIGLVVMTFTTYILAYILYPFIPSDTATLLPADILAMCLFTYLGCLFWQRCFIRNYRKIKAGVDLNKLSLFQRRPGAIIFFSMTTVLVLIALVFVYFYTCHMSDGKICLGYSIFSDFSPHVAITSGFGVGSNFPTQYPHFAGDNIQYHFMFYFLTGNMEALGLPLVWAINIPSLLCMLSTLTLLGTLAVLLSGRRAAYLFAPLLVLFRSGWNVFHQVGELRDAGSSWGSVFKFLAEQSSWYGYTFRDEWGLWAVNVYANQRHLAVGVGIIVIFIFLFLPHFRRMFLHLTRTEGFKEKCKRFFASREAWIHRKDDPLKPWGSVILLSLVAAVMPFFHGSCLISALLVLFGMAIFSEFRLGYAVVALVSVVSSVLQARFFAGGAGNVATFKYFFGFVIPELNGKNQSGFGTALSYSGKVISYLNKIGYLTVIIPCVLFFTLLIYELVKRKNPYRAILLIPFSFPLIFAFYCQVSLEVLANHKFIQVSFILFDILIAGVLANLLALPIPIKERLPQPKKKKKKAETERVFALSKKTFIPVQIASAVVCLGLTFGLTATGISEWFIYRNINCCENGKQYYITLDPNAPIVDWVKKNTDEDDIFLTPMWSTNDFFLAGRRVYYGWPYFAWSAGHDTETRQINYQWLLSGANNNIDEFRRYCAEMNIKYVICCPDYYGPEETDGFYNPDFFEANLKEAVRFDDQNMIIYKV
ncbi:MAG: hypothetical protein IKD90_12870 [Clostridiales bacterium]|nr:hypothetical protein [Clostridiales bacterium]